MGGFLAAECPWWLRLVCPPQAAPRIPGRSLCLGIAIGRSRWQVASIAAVEPGHAGCHLCQPGIEGPAFLLDEYLCDRAAVAVGLGDVHPEVAVPEQAAQVFEGHVGVGLAALRRIDPAQANGEAAAVFQPRDE
jgi:hypothetical protein